MKLSRLLMTLTWGLTATVAASIAGKVVRSAVLSSHNVRYFPKDIEGEDLDLAIRITPSEAEEILHDTKERLVWLRDVRRRVEEEPEDVHQLVDLDKLISQLEKEENKGRLFENDPVDYWNSSEGRIYWGAVKERLDDLSFINTIGILAFAALLLNSLTRGGIGTSETVFSGFSLNLGRRGLSTWLVVAVVVTMYGLVPQVGHYQGDHGPIHGTFWTENFIPAVAATQWVDGVLWVLVGVVSGILVVAYAFMVGHFKAHLTLEDLSRYNHLIRAPLYPLVLVAICITVVAVDPWGWDFHAIAPNHIIYLSVLYLSLVGVGFFVGCTNLPKGFYREVSPNMRGLLLVRVASVTEDSSLENLLQQLVRDPEGHREAVAHWAEAHGLRTEEAIERIRQSISVAESSTGGVVTGGLASEYRAAFYSCFISYSKADEEFARQLHADLQKNGVRCWFAPEDMKIGEPILGTINEAIHLLEKLVLVLSDTSIESDWVEHEVKKALEEEEARSKHVLFPIRVDEAVMTCEFGWAKRIREAHKPTGRHIGDFTKWNDRDTYQAAFQRLLRDLQRE